MKKSLVLFLAVFAFSAAIISSCKKDKKEDPKPTCVVDNMSFASDITPIMNTNCSTSGCHDNVTTAAGIRLDTFPNISENADLIIKSIKHLAGAKPMPAPAGTDKLSDCDISKFEAWVAQGKKNN